MRHKFQRRVACLAVMVLAIGSVHGQAKWVGDRGAMEGELHTKAVQSSSPWVTYSVDSPSGPGRVRAKIDLRYRLWRLTGEPVWSYEPRYEFGTIELGSNSIVRDDSLEGEALIAEMMPEGSIHLRVSRELFESIRIRDLHVVARFTHFSLTGISEPIYHNAWISAVFARPGEWAWDVPASPAWDETFTTEGDPLEQGQEIQQWVDGKEAKACWTRLENAWRGQKTPALEYLRCYRMKLDLSNFWMRVEAQQPGVTRPFFNRIVPGESFEQAAQRNALEYQIQSLLNGVSKEVEASRTSSGGPRATAKLKRRLEITEQAFLLFKGDPPAHMIESLETAKRQLTGDLLDEGMRILSESWKAGAEESEILLNTGTLEDLERLGASIDAAGAEVPPATRRRWESLQSLQSGFRGTVVAEWTGPALPAQAYSSGGSIGYIRLSQLSTGPNGRTLALFAWEAEYAHDEGHYGYILVDATTGEELHRDLHGDGGEDDVALFGEAEFVAELHGSGYYEDVYKLYGLWHVDSKRMLSTPWKDNSHLFVVAWDTRRAFLMDRKNDGHIEAWDYTTGDRLWKSTELSSSFDYNRTTLRFGSNKDWILARETEFDSHSAVLDVSTGNLLFEWRKKRATNDELEQEAYRVKGTDPSPAFVLPQLPAGYAYESWSSRWSADGDAFICVKPGTVVRNEASMKGSLRYQLLK